MNSTTSTTGRMLRPDPQDVEEAKAAHAASKQRELPLTVIYLKPLHLLYLLAIYTGDFDSRLHKGHFAQHEVFAERIRELILYGLIGYDGQHFLTKKGNAHVDVLIRQPVQS